MSVLDTKTCTKCSAEKPLTEFHRCGAGHKPDCKQCRSEQAKKARLDNPPTAAQKERKKAQTRRWRAQKMQENPNYYNDEYYRRHESVLINARRYYYKNQQSCINKMQHWRNNNPEKMKASADNWRRQNPEKLRDGHRCWLQKNKEHVRFYNACRRALKRNATIQVFTDEQLNARMSM